MATSPNYGWLEPDNTDLVKNGALAIRTLGNAIDTTMATMTPKSTFTAKGSIAAATAASTPANLAVGADYGFLQALASESTGLKWNSGAWTNYTPTLTAGSGSFTSATANAYYQRIGKTCVLSWSVSITTNGTAASSTLITLPFTAASGSNRYWTGVAREFSVVGLNGVSYMGNGGTQLIILNSTGGYFGGNSYLLAGTIVYEVA